MVLAVVGGPELSIRVAGEELRIPIVLGDASMARTAWLVACAWAWTEHALHQIAGEGAEGREAITRARRAAAEHREPEPAPFLPPDPKGHR